MLLRAFNLQGIDRFRAALQAMRDGRQTEVPVELLSDDACTEELSAEIDVAVPIFTTRLSMGEWLKETLTPLSRDEIDRNRGLWAWLSLCLFDVVCPLRADGLRRPGRDYRHIPDFGYRHRHRHLLFGPYELVRRHGAKAIVLLAGPPHTESGLYHEIASRQDLVANSGVLEAAVKLYMDRTSGGPKRGARGSGATPGTVIRFVRVLQQLDLTFDIYGMNGKQILELLPAEFDAWRKG